MKQNRILQKKSYLTILSVVSAISVVFLHTNGCFWIFSNDRYWMTANIIESLFYFAVPIFFMISGATLLDYKEKYSTIVYFKKRTLKTVIPFIIWSIIGLLFCIFFTKSIQTSEISISYIINGILNTSFISIYWFFIPLFVVYLVIPILASINKEEREKVFLYYVVISLLLNSLFPFINNVFNLNLLLPLRFTLGSEYIVYVIIGYLLDKHEIGSKFRLLIYVLAILGLFLHMFGTYVLSIDAGKIVKTYKGYTNIPCILYSIGIFVFVKEISKKIKRKRFIDFFSYYTFSIYLIHYYIITILLKTFQLKATSIIYRLGLPFAVIPICIIISYLLRKIPFIKHIVP